MKKIVLAVLTIVFSINISLAAVYTPTAEDSANLTALKAQLLSLVADDNEALRNYYYQLKVLHKEFLFNDRLEYMLRYLRDYLGNLIFVRKTQAKSTSMLDKWNFVQEFSGEVITPLEITDRCTGWYNTLDDIAFTHDFPTAVLVATWYRESSCGYYLPSNTRGPFQITSKNYGTGDITEEIFVEAVVDFIHFAKNKFARYENANSDAGLTVDLDYDTISYDGIVRHGALYNGLSGYTVYGEALPLNPKYVFDNYGNEFSGATKNGLMTQTIEFLKWELENKY